jgi:hypothetical protein
VFLEKVRAIQPKYFASGLHSVISLAGVITIGVGLISGVGWTTALGFGIVLESIGIGLVLRSLARAVELSRSTEEVGPKLTAVLMTGHTLTGIVGVAGLVFIFVRAALASPAALAVVTFVLLSYCALIAIHLRAHGRKSIAATGAAKTIEPANNA